MEFYKKLENKNKIAKVKYATYIENNDPGSDQNIMLILNKILERLDRVETKVDNIDKNQQEMRVEFNNRIDNIVIMNNLKE